MLHAREPVVAIIITIAVASFTQGNTIHVDATNCPRPGDGSEVDPYCSIQVAINAAATGDEVVVFPGEYFEAIDLLGRAITVRSTDPTNPAVVAATVINGNSAWHVVRCMSGEGPDTVLHGLTITGGSANGSGDDLYGGGLLVNSSPTVRSCVFIGNNAYDGAAVFNDHGSTAHFVDCVFDGNTADHLGGGMYVRPTASPTVSACIFSSNTADGGGAVHVNTNTDNVASFEDCMFAGNIANSQGGAISLSVGAVPYIQNSVFCGNMPNDIWWEPGGSGWTDGGGNCFTDQCTDNNSNGIPDGCEETSQLAGAVHDQETFQTLEGVSVEFLGLQDTTGPDGTFNLVNLPGTSGTLVCSRTGYYTVTQNVVLNPDSANYETVQMIAEDSGDPADTPVVIAVSAEYSSPSQHAYYLDGVPLEETFEATIDWNGFTPDEVIFTTPQDTFPATGSGSSWTTTLDMGTDFSPGGLLMVQAVAGDGTSSPPCMANLQVVAVPINTPALVLAPDLSSPTLKYTTTDSPLGILFSEGVAAGIIPQEIPLFGNEEFQLQATIVAEGAVQGDGTASFVLGRLDGGLPTKVAGADFNMTIGGTLLWNYSPSANAWLPGGQVTFSGHAGFDVPPEPAPFTIFGVPAYWQGHIDLDVADGTNLSVQQEWTVEDPVWSGQLYLDPFPHAEAILGVGVADALAVEGHLGGGATIGLDYTQDPALQQLDLYLAGSVRVVAWIFSWEEEAFECTWDAIADVGQCDLPLSLQVVPRGYLGNLQGYAIFTANDLQGQAILDPLTEEIKLEHNIYPRSQPSLTTLGDNRMLVWLYDDPARTPVNRTELAYSYYEGGIWNPDPPEPVADDGTADFHPDTATLPDADVLVAWENVYEVLAEPDDPDDPGQVELKYEELKSKTEITVASWDYETGFWSEQEMLTDNEVLDRSPKLSVADDTAMLTWVANASNDPVGTLGAPNDVYFSLFDGVGWSAPALAATGVPSIVKYDMAYNGTEAFLIYSADMDDNLDTLDDRELFVLWYDLMPEQPESPDGLWSGPEQLTANTWEDGNPQIIYDPMVPTWLVAWYSDGNLLSSVDPLDLSQAVIDIAFEGDSSGVADFRLATGETGQLGVVWQGASEDAVDFWYAIFDPFVGTWSLGQRLTFDDSLEHAPTASFDTSGRLLVGYNKAQTVYETRFVKVGGEQVEVQVPQPGETDLYILEHSVSGNLAMVPDTLLIDPPNPMPNTTATISALVRNDGDATAAGLEVAFYDGDDLIGVDIIDQLIGGQQAEAMMTWTVPEAMASRTICVTVDPNAQHEDIDATDDTICLEGVLKPDLIVPALSADNAGMQDRLITVRVQNSGALPIEATAVQLREGPDMILTTLSVSEALLPGAYRDVVYLWEDAAPFPGGATDLNAIVDPDNQVMEFNEDDNVATIHLTSPPCPWDLDDDGAVGTTDFLELLAQWGTDPGGPPDFDGDGTVGTPDFLELLAHWGSCP